MIITSWNVNSVKARLAHVQRWVGENKPDVLMLQEIKTEAAGFPADAMHELGFIHQEIVGQKSYNGVALLSKFPITDIITRLPGAENDDDQARFVGGTINGVRVFNLYAPNGNPLDGPKFPFKLSWLQRLHDFAKAELAREMPVLFAGDFNIIPTTTDAATPAAWRGDALMQPESQRAYFGMLNLGYTDAYRIHNIHNTDYSFFDYRAGAWQKNDGIRIDHILLSPEACDRAQKCWIASDPEISPRAWDTPSDHVPITISIHT